MEKKNVIVHQTDERMFYLASMLKGASFVRHTHVFAPNVLIEAKTLTAVEDGANVFCGRCLNEAIELANSRDINLYKYNDSEVFQAINSRLTAEGTLKTMIEHSQKSIADCYVFVMGFGRTGAAVAKILAKLDIKFDIATTSSRARHTPLQSVFCL